MLFLSRAAVNELLHQKLESQTSPLKSWTVVAMLEMAVLDTEPLDRERENFRIHAVRDSIS